MTPGEPTSVAEYGNDTIPDEFVLHQNYPNPFNPGTEISYSIPRGYHKALVRLTIYDLSGKKIRTLINERQASGSYQIRWDGRNDAGQLVASGLFMYKLNYKLVRLARVVKCCC